MSKRVREAVRVSHPCGGDLYVLYCSSGPANFAVLYAHGFGSVHWGETSQALERALVAVDRLAQASAYTASVALNGAAAPPA